MSLYALSPTIFGLRRESARKENINTDKSTSNGRTLKVPKDKVTQKDGCPTTLVLDKKFTLRWKGLNADIYSKHWWLTTGSRKHSVAVMRKFTQPANLEDEPDSTIPLTDSGYNGPPSNMSTEHVVIKRNLQFKMDILFYSDVQEKIDHNPKQTNPCTTKKHGQRSESMSMVNLEKIFQLEILLHNPHLLIIIIMGNHLNTCKNKNVVRGFHRVWHSI